MIKIDETKQVCGRCLAPIHNRLKFRNFGTEICYGCYHELQIASRVQSAHNHGITLTEYTRNGLRTAICPFCAHRATVYGQTYKYLLCIECGAIYQFNDGKFTGLVYDYHSKRYLPQELFQNIGKSEVIYEKTNQQKLEDLGL